MFLGRCRGCGQELTLPRDIEDVQRVSVKCRNPDCALWYTPVGYVTNGEYLDAEVFMVKQGMLTANPKAQTVDGVTFFG